ncbi:FAD-binding protein [Legionella sp. PATHC032]|uniref:FAD-binding protein n=1 Tax=Legionella sp. PATHC032 TaxID=2992039 RepID=UPI001B006171|nr:FAD-binding protein [Legionella sp. PATHC032]MCW8420199.1 FAD-binding protein [Legionella sp. PATHC032]HAZ7573060.1 FAD-binding protein [Legionella pneumophila]HBA1636041.1 FAD-binding protein [Legionella pneumophila]
MRGQVADVVIAGAGPVGLMCAYLGQLCGIHTVIVDKSDGPLEVGRADALNARTLQLLELVDLFDELYPLGKTCNTSSVWANGQFISRQSSWWEELEGCLHKHFLMLGQSYVEKLLDEKLKETATAVKRSTAIVNIETNEEGCLTTLVNGERIQSRYVIGADGSRSFVRDHFAIPFEIIRPPIIWAVIDGIIDSDFPKVQEIIVFQAETSDVAWIPREGKIDRFYVRMDTKNFTLQEAMDKINHAMRPHSLNFKDIVWFSQFSVKESVAEHFFIQDRIFLAGDACHIHSVNGGQGLNTGLGDAFNLMWKLHMVMHFGAPKELLHSYENERKPVAHDVIETSGELVRSTKYSLNGTHAQDYVRIVQKRAGYITGMGIRYGESGLRGSRLFDFEIFNGIAKTRLYSLLDYMKFTLLIFGDREVGLQPPEFIKVIQIYPHQCQQSFWTNNTHYANEAILVRPDSYIQDAVPLDKMESIFEMAWLC